MLFCSSRTVDRWLKRFQAVRILGIAPRTLRLKLRGLGLCITGSVEGGKDDSA